MLHRANDSGAAKPASDFKPPIGQLLRNEITGARFLEAKLRMGVNVATDLLNFSAELNDSVDQLHEFCGLSEQKGNATRTRMGP